MRPKTPKIEEIKFFQRREWDLQEEAVRTSIFLFWLIRIVALVTAVAAVYQIFVTPLTELVSDTSFWIKVLIFLLCVSIKFISGELYEIRRDMKTSVLELKIDLESERPEKAKPEL